MKNSPTAISKSDQALTSYQNFASFAAEVTKIVHIRIALQDLQDLKDANYKLCFAKKVGDFAYNVVWQSYSDYLFDNKFSWTPQYQLFGSNRFNSDVEVEVSTNTVDIGLGETSKLNSAGILSEPNSGGSDLEFTMINEFGKIHPGVNQLSTGIHGKQDSTPIYVAEKPIVTGKVQLRPVEKVLVWFEQNIETSTMFSKAKAKAVEIDLTNTNVATREYTGGEWIKP